MASTLALASADRDVWVTLRGCLRPIVQIGPFGTQPEALDWQATRDAKHDPNFLGATVDFRIERVRTMSPSEY